MGRRKIKKYEYTCDRMKFVTHAPDGRKYESDMVALCDETAVFEGIHSHQADHKARKAGWLTEDGTYTCPVNEHSYP